MQPQNRFLGKLRSYINGMSPYPETSIPLKEEDKIELGNQSKEIRAFEMKESLHKEEKNTNLVEVKLENN